MHNFKLSTAKCPSSSAILPCTCVSYVNQISCWNIKADVNLRQIFVNLTNLIGDKYKEKPIIFDEFKLVDSELTQLGTPNFDDPQGDVFAGIAFNKIHILQNSKLNMIYRNAFK